MTRKTILVVDDEQENRASLKDLLSDEYQVCLARDGVEALRAVEEQVPDLVLLDILMPRMDGLQTCLRLRQQGATRGLPIIFLTSKNQPETEAFGLELGADDFIPKPFNKEVLKARIRRRLGGNAAQAAEVTSLGDYKVYWQRQEAGKGETFIPLTTKEVGMLRLFVDNPGRVLTRDVILEKVWSETYITDRTIDSHVKELRKKIPPLAQLLKTVYGSGYRLDL
ncbi:MAG TPA: response regulator transcription factor [bacterium]|nr:response regulator transcription factor [bacterium]